MQSVELNVVVRDRSLHVEGVELMEDLKMVTVDAKLKEFYDGEQSRERLEHIVVPVEIKSQKDCIVLLVQDYGETLSSMRQFEYEQLQQEHFLQQILEIYVSFAQIRPMFTESNIKYMAKRPIKTLPTQIAQSDQKYISQFKEIIGKVYSSEKGVKSRCEEISELVHIKAWAKELKPSTVEGKSIPELLQLRAAVQKQPGPKIQFTQQEQTWVFQTLGMESLPKMEQIYEGAGNLFDPETFIKAINKRRVLILIESASHKRVAFAPGIKIDHKPNGMFGSYQEDKDCKSLLFGLSTHSVHPLKDSKHAFGLGQQILLSIGYCDIVLSASNMSNVCLFPVSYQCDEGRKVTADELIGKEFVLKQVEAWTYQEVKKQQEPKEAQKKQKQPTQPKEAEKKDKKPSRPKESPQQPPKKKDKQ